MKIKAKHDTYILEEIDLDGTFYTGKIISIGEGRIFDHFIGDIVKVRYSDKPNVFILDGKHYIAVDENYILSELK